MLKQTSSRFTMGVLVVAAVMLAVAGTSIASNMGFKLNKPLGVTSATVAEQGNNWTSIPFFNPYGNVGAFCSQTGLPAGLQKATVTIIDPTVTPNGTTSTVSCGTAAANTLLLVAGRGVRVRNPSNAVPVVNSIIIVGSHNPAQSVTVPKASTPGTGGQFGNLWFSVPYHTTAVTAADLCLSSGLTSTGLQKATITRENGANGAVTTVSCGTSAAGTLNLVLGEAVRMRDPNGATFIPAHF